MPACTASCRSAEPSRSSTSTTSSASPSCPADRVNAGNADLQPQRAWEFRGTIEKPIFGDGLVKVDVGYDQISMVQDRILIYDEENDRYFDAPGNLGTGKRSFIAWTVDAPLTRFGLKGARLKFTGQLQRTRVEDPISGEMRNFSDFFPDWNWQADYRHDLGDFSYGFVVSDRDRFTFFRTDEYRHQLERRRLMRPPSSSTGRTRARPSRSISTTPSTPRTNATGCYSGRTAPNRTPSSTSSASAIATSRWD